MWTSCPDYLQVSYGEQDSIVLATRARHADNDKGKMEGIPLAGGHVS